MSFLFTKVTFFVKVIGILYAYGEGLSLIGCPEPNHYHDHTTPNETSSGLGFIISSFERGDER